MKFYHRIAGAKFFMPDGKDIAFAGGSFDTASLKDPKVRDAVELELRKVANVAASQIFTTEKPIIAEAEREVAAELRAGAEVAFDAANKVPAGARTIAMAMPKNSPPVLTGVEQGPETAKELSPLEKAKAAVEKAKVTGNTAQQDHS